MKSASAARRFAALALATVVAGTTLVPAGEAQANDALAAGLLGVVVGATVFAPRYPVYVAPAYPVYAAPPPVVVYEEPAYVEPAPVYVQPAYPEPYYDRHRRRSLATVPADPYYGRKPPRSGPRVVTYEDTVGPVATIEPWTPAWHDYCRARFRSFDSRSGTFLGYDGNRHFCVAK